MVEEDRVPKGGDQEPGIWKRTTLVARGGGGRFDRGASWVLPVLAVVAILVPVLNQVVPTL